MNDRITKIIIETLGKEGVIDSRAFGHWALSDDQLEMFAELIVKECVRKVNEDTTPDSGYTYEPWKLLEHFGVE